MRDRRSTAEGHILISGTGRAGTTVLMQYFTALGFDTGFTLEESLTRIDAISRGGLERKLVRGDLAYVSKSPSYSRNLGEHLETGRVRVRHLLVPIRELHAAAESRHQVSRRAEAAGRDPKNHPGGRAFGGNKKPNQMRRRLAVQLYRLLHDAARFDIPVTLLPFPEFGRSHTRLYGPLSPLLVEHGVSETESRTAYDTVFDTSHIHEY